LTSSPPVPDLHRLRHAGNARCMSARAYEGPPRGDHHRQQCRPAVCGCRHNFIAVLRLRARDGDRSCGEPSKSLQMLARLYDELANAKVDRASPVIALGGGVVGDLTGFAAATWLRGVPFVQVPTSLEADVDSSVGGKTGVNHASGKNMIGAFYQPLFVLIDTATLSTLSRRDFVAGLAESVKHAVIRDAAFFDWHESNCDAILAHDADALGRLIERNVQIKAQIVSLDERETTGMRALLNFGHTVGHAIETVMARRGEPWRHGEAVAAGMVAACEVSVQSAGSNGNLPSG